MNKLIQEVVTFCAKPYSGTSSGFTAEVSNQVKKILEDGYIIKSVSTTSYMDCGKPVIVYTFLTERVAEVPEYA